MRTATPPDDTEIMRKLIHQVQRAAEGGVETRVRTIVTRPMWRAWCRAVGLPENSKPTQWLGPAQTRRIFGSETVVVESNEMFSLSFRPA